MQNNGASRDHAWELDELYGLSTQQPAYRAGEVERIHLTYKLLSDANLAFQRAPNLPLFDIEVAGMPALKWATLICDDARITQVFYLAFPPDRSGAEQVIDWLRSRSKQG